MTENQSPDQVAIADIYKLAIAGRDMEINQLVQRNNFFMIFQGVLLAGLLQAAGNGKIIPVVSLLACIAGLVVSLLQVGMAAGAKFWQERWESAVEATERFLLEEQPKERSKLFELFSSGDKHFDEIVKERLKDKDVFTRYLVGARFSPSRLPLYAALVFAVIWLVLIVAQLVPLHFFSWIAGFRSIG